MTDYRNAAEIISERLGDVRVVIAVLLGSGLGAIANQLTNPIAITYQELPGFPPPTIKGHTGRLLVGGLHGVTIACLQGRGHYYEGCTPTGLAVPLRTLHALGCKTLLLTNAAGSLRKTMGVGSLMMITDHINWAGVNPLIGPNDEALGPRFFDLTRAYAPALQTRLREAAADAGINLHEGVYLMCAGPNFETPAEIRAFAILGADAVGMSTVPECLVANHCGMQVAAVSVITNLAAGITGAALSHDETLARGALAIDKVSRLLRFFLPRIAG